MADCPICLEEITDDAATFPCSNHHAIHGRCLTNMISSFVAAWNGGPMQLPRCPMCRVPATRQAAQTNPHFRAAVRRRANQLGVHVPGTAVTTMEHIEDIVGRNPNAAMIGFMLFLALLIMGAKWVAETGWKPGAPLG
jgi:Zinc finger, C3HC4 type (RING finger)